MEMTRSELILTVEEAALKAHMTNDVTARVVNAVADPKVAHVVRGDWNAYGELCPATLAGLEPGKDKIAAFARNFDSLTREAAVEAVKGLDPYNRERYIIRIV